MPPSNSRATKRAKTLRKMTSSNISEEDLSNAEKVMVERTNIMESRAKEGVPLSEEELTDVINSLQNITPKDAKIEWDELKRLLSEIAHLSHKKWEVTGENSSKMGKILTPNGLTAESHQMFERILHEGNWDGALEHAKSIKRGENKLPWAVLVTGVNGIRKTTAMYQPWFSEVLKEALVAPEGKPPDFAIEVLPNGENSFFRQLDHMITTLCNEDFSALYALTGAQLSGEDSPKDGDPPKDVVKKYSNLKASIFSRYRTLSELLGALLLREAQDANINVMCETSGRDVAMFQYIDHFFQKGYNKLALHFTVSDLSCAMKSVDDRMAKEIKTGKRALELCDVVEVIYANAGGPYGSEVLEGVQADSDRVWTEIVMQGSGVGEDWYKASLKINAHLSEPWTIQAVLPDGSLGTKHTFGAPRVAS